MSGKPARATAAPPPAPPRTGLAGAALAGACLGLLVLGAAVGVAGAAVQGGWFPGGLLLALLATAAVFVGGQRATGSQLGLGAAALGWLVSVILLSTGRPEGDGAFAAGIGPLVYLLGGMVIAVICVTLRRPAVPFVPPGTRGGR